MHLSLLSFSDKRFERGFVVGWGGDGRRDVSIKGRESRSWICGETLGSLTRREARAESVRRVGGETHVPSERQMWVSPPDRFIGR